MSIINEIKAYLPQIIEFIDLADKYYKEVIEENKNRDSIYQEMSSKLKSWEYRNLLLLESLMYIGQSDFIDRSDYTTDYDYYRDIEAIRGHSYTPEKALNNMYNYLHDLNQYTSPAGHMLEKLLLSRYLKQGLDVLRIKRIEEFSSK
ncbi:MULTISPECIES: hypothetical protein [Paenibacillus]|jgi:hypothetical protein|uniref:hypothetical protein n=1 Tax=Paenibacillus TaxID=44249 RepID=UPI00096C5E45|nr:MULTISPECIES: hypothetical protein [Paenibacillus]MBP1177419.1 hypothetical protein [Paenibacillus sp. PvR133]OMF34755.1 hypothetical protein BK134_05730 [Paenibacillus peoriae]